MVCRDLLAGSAAYDTWSNANIAVLASHSQEPSAVPVRDVCQDPQKERGNRQRLPVTCVTVPIKSRLASVGLCAWVAAGKRRAHHGMVHRRHHGVTALAASQSFDDQRSLQAWLLGISGLHAITYRSFFWLIWDCFSAQKACSSDLEADKCRGMRGCSCFNRGPVHWIGPLSGHHASCGVIQGPVYSSVHPWSRLSRLDSNGSDGAQEAQIKETSSLTVIH